MAVDDHGLEVLKKSGEQVSAGDKSNHFIKVAGATSTAGTPAAIPVSFPAGVEVTQDTHDDLNANANIQIANTDVGAGNPVPVSLTPAAVSPTIFNKSVPTKNVEVSQVLTANVQKFTVQNRDNGLIKLAFVTAESGTKFISIFPGAVYSEDGINTASLTLFMQSPKDSQTVEIVEWA